MNRTAWSWEVSGLLEHWAVGQNFARNSHSICVTLLQGHCYRLALSQVWLWVLCNFFFFLSLVCLQNFHLMDYHLAIFITVMLARRLVWTIISEVGLSEDWFPFDFWPSWVSTTPTEWNERTVYLPIRPSIMSTQNIVTDVLSIDPHLPHTGKA